MNKLLPFAIAFLVLTIVGTPLRAQKDFEVKIRSAGDIMTPATAEIALTVDVKKRCAIPAVLLSGVALQLSVAGKSGPKIVQRASGKVTVAGGTRIERAIRLDLSKVRMSKSGFTRISLQWIGLQGVSTVMSVAPDLTNVDVADLDLSRTKVLLVTTYGNMVVRFFPDKAPKTVAAFIQLSKSGFYDGTRFHRVMRDFMIQGGCPNSKDGATGKAGSGGPGYTLPDEFNDTRHVKGVLSMANTGAPHSAGCQFFIVHKASSFLDGKYTAFGELVSGHDTLDKIASVEVMGAPEKSTPVKPVYIKAAIVQPVFKAKRP